MPWSTAKRLLVIGLVPNFVVTLALALELAPGLMQDIDEGTIKIGHLLRDMTIADDRMLAAQRKRYLIAILLVPVCVEQLRDHHL